jgi:dUTP pyrophosphatase
MNYVESIPVKSFGNELFQATTGSAGYDLISDVNTSLLPSEVFVVPTGTYLEIPKGFEGQIRPRSSLGKNGIIIPNAPGTIDSDYRGEIKVLLLNLGADRYIIKKGDRIAQIIFTRVSSAIVTHSTNVELSPTNRGAGGFGSSGK